MSKAKNAILDRIRAGLGREALSEGVKKSMGEKIVPPDQRIIPERVQLSGPLLIEEFLRMTNGEATTVNRLKRDENVPNAVTEFLRAHGLPPSVVLAPDDTIGEMPWDESGLQIRQGRAEKDDLTSVTPGFAGIAETGCFMLISGPDHPYTLNFLPENHIVVLDSSRIVATPEDAFGLLRDKFGAGNMPRTTLMVAGPSRSADIGTSLQFGAHGPKRLHCILINGEHHAPRNRHSL
jgi:L-lactate dehydrogenase complex protein LldG